MKQLDLNELRGPHRVAPFARASVTSREAAVAIRNVRPSQRERVLEFIRDRGGATCFEVEQALGLKHQSAAARIWEMHHAGQVRDSGQKRPTGPSTRATVWVAVWERAGG